MCSSLKAKSFVCWPFHGWPLQPGRARLAGKLNQCGCCSGAARSKENTLNAMFFSQLWQYTDRLWTIIRAPWSQYRKQPITISRYVPMRAWTSNGWWYRTSTKLYNMVSRMPESHAMAAFLATWSAMLCHKSTWSIQAWILSFPIWKVYVVLAALCTIFLVLHDTDQTT